MAVYTHLTKQEIEHHLEKYSIGKLVDFKGIIGGIDNTNYLITTTQNRFILTIFESRIKEEDLPFFINFKLHLAKKGIHCPKPILDNSGQSLVELKGKRSAIVSFLEGKALEPREDGYFDNITVNHCAEIGKNLAKLHLEASDFAMKRHNDLSVHDWRKLFGKFENLLDNYQKNLREEILQNLNFLENSWKNNLPQEVVHLDLFPDNVFFEGEKLKGIIDFYFSATESLVYDLAITINAWCFDEKNNFCQEKYDALLHEYKAKRQILAEEQEFLPIALRGSAMRFLLTRLHDMFFTPEGSLVKIKDPKEYLQKLRFWNGKTPN